MDTSMLSDPDFLYILLLLGVSLIYFEFHSNGFVAGSLGAVCLILASVGAQTLPVNYPAFGLIVLAYILFLLETHFLSYGVLTVAGLGAFVTGSLFLFDTDKGYVVIDHSLIWTSLVIVTVFVVSIFFYLKKEKARLHLPKDYYSLIGKEATVVTSYSESDKGVYTYQVKVGGEIWQAQSEHHYHVGEKCIIKSDSEDLILKI